MCQCTETSVKVSRSEAITRDDIALFNRFSRNTLAKLPTEWQIDHWQLDSPSEKRIRHCLHEGRLAMVALSADDLDAEEATALYTHLVQTDLLLTALGSQSAASPSCIGKCTGEKTACKGACEQKFCGCTWNSFLCKANCFISVKVDI